MPKRQSVKARGGQTESKPRRAARRSSSRWPALPTVLSPAQSAPTACATGAAQYRPDAPLCQPISHSSHANDRVPGQGARGSGKVSSSSTIMAPSPSSISSATSTHGSNNVSSSSNVTSILGTVGRKLQRVSTARHTNSRERGQRSVKKTPRVSPKTSLSARSVNLHSAASVAARRGTRLLSRDDAVTEEDGSCKPIVPSLASRSATEDFNLFYADEEQVLSPSSRPVIPVRYCLSNEEDETNDYAVVDANEAAPGWFAWNNTADSNAEEDNSSNNNDNDNNIRDRTGHGRIDDRVQEDKCVNLGNAVIKRPRKVIKLDKTEAAPHGDGETSDSGVPESTSVESAYARLTMMRLRAAQAAGFFTPFQNPSSERDDAQSGGGGGDSSSRNGNIDEYAWLSQEKNARSRLMDLRQKSAPCVDSMMTDRCDDTDKNNIGASALESVTAGDGNRSRSADVRTQSSDGGAVSTATAQLPFLSATTPSGSSTYVQPGAMNSMSHAHTPPPMRGVNGAVALSPKQHGQKQSLPGSRGAAASVKRTRVSKQRNRNSSSASTRVVYTTGVRLGDDVAGERQSGAAVPSASPVNSSDDVAFSPPAPTPRVRIIAAKPDQTISAALAASFPLCTTRPHPTASSSSTFDSGWHNYLLHQPDCVVVDTSTLIDADPGVLNILIERWRLCVPFTVIDELDKLNKERLSLSNRVTAEQRAECERRTRQARVMRDWIASALCRTDNMTRIQKRSEVLAEYERHSQNNDDAILGYAVYLMNKGEKVIFVSEDKFLRIKAKAELKGAYTYADLKRMLGVKN